MANESSLAGNAAQFVFDLETPKGVMHFLASVRASTITPEQKNELRDLAFLYANGGHDESVRITLQQKISTYGVAPVPQAVTTATPAIVYDFGTSRPAPTFTAPRTTPSPNAPSAAGTPAPAPAPGSVPAAASEPVSAPITPPSPTPAPTPVPATAAVPPPEPAAAAVPAASVPPPPAAPAVPVAETPPPPPTPAPVAPEPQPEVVAATPTPTPAQSAEPITTSSPGATDAMQRIREIKSLVNERVGNPVNLVDINNEVGREYMAALLDAMKKINSGTSATSAMTRLEAAYQQVEQTLDAHDATAAAAAAPVPTAPPVAVATAPRSEEVTPEATTSQTPEPLPTAVAPTPDTATAVSSAPEPAQTPVPPPKESREPAFVPPEVEYVPEPVPVPTPEPVAPAPMPEPAPEPFPEPEPLPSPEPARQSIPVTAEGSAVVQPPPPEPLPTAPAPESLNIPPSTPSSTSGKIPVVPAGAPAPVPTKRSPNEIEAAWGPATDTLRPQVDPSSLAQKVTSVADAKEKFRTPDQLPSAAEVSSVEGDPLFTKEVDDGLQQLLSEWSLFKKSGLFGTGPKGREHPLFKKIADLQIPLLLAGRFEGATQEVKQSITDYMNGWRYEQGIIYEQGETFERYLRRVIRHILDLQKKKQRS